MWNLIIKNKKLINTGLLGLALTFQSEAATKNKQEDKYPIAQNIYNDFLKMRADLKATQGSFNINDFAKKHGLELSSEDKKFMNKVVLWGKPSLTLQTSYSDGVISWKDNSEAATIDLRELERGKLKINENTIQLDLTSLASFKDTYKANSPKIKKALLKDAIAKLSIFEMIVKVITMPFAHADQTDGSGCVANRSNDTGSASTAIFKGLGQIFDAPFKAVGYVTKPICSGLNCVDNSTGGHIPGLGTATTMLEGL